MPSKYLPGASVGYNANTGASAKWDEASGAWIDSSGQSIRDDAIRAEKPEVSGNAPTATAPAAASGGATAAPAPSPQAGTGGVGSASSAMAGLQAAGPEEAAQHMFSGPSTLRQGIGSRVPPMMSPVLTGLRSIY